MRRPVPALALLACVGATAPAAAVSFTLAEREQAEAVRIGERSVSTEEVFGTEWTQSTAAGELMVMTPFYHLALAARQNAFKQKPMTPADIDKILREDKGRLVFWVSLRGPRGDFARFYTPVLMAGGAELKPSLVQNERSPLREADGRYLARCVYGFATATLGEKAKVVLVVRDRDGKEVARFPVDLAAMR
jgi:hypothetical protein